MKRAIVLIALTLAFLAQNGIAEPASDAKPSPAPAKSKVAAKKITPKKSVAEAKSEKTSPALDRLFDDGKLMSPDSRSHHPDSYFSGGAEMSFFVSGR